MCGLAVIVARKELEACADLSGLAQALDRLRSFDAGAAAAPSDLEALLGELESLVQAACAWPTFRALSTTDAARRELDALARALCALEQAIERRLGEAPCPRATLDRLALCRDRASDLAFRIERDVLENVRKVESLAAGETSPGLSFELWRLNLLINQLERLEPRGRISSAVATLVHLAPPAFAAFESLVAERGLEAALSSRRAAQLRDDAIVVARGASGFALAFLHEAIGDGDAPGHAARRLRAKARSDALYRLALGTVGARVQAIASTRRAEDGLVAQTRAAGPAASSAEVASLTLASITVVGAPGEALSAVALEPPRSESKDAFEAALAWALLPPGESLPTIVTMGSDAPGTYALAAGAPDRPIHAGPFPGGVVFASDLAAVVELARTTFRLESGVLHFLDDADELRLKRGSGPPEPLARCPATPVSISTRDLDRGPHAHYLAREIAESPRALRRTLRARFSIASERTHLELGDDAIPPAIRDALAAGAIRAVFVVGDELARAAAAATADFLASLVDGSGMAVTAIPAVELGQVPRGALVVALVSRGSNRDAIQGLAPGSHVLAITFGLGSLPGAEGVLVASDGRDIEMSRVATKSFPALVGAGYLLALGIAEAAGALDLGHPAEGRALEAVRLLRELSDLARRMEEGLAASLERVRVAAQLALPRRDWAVSGASVLRFAAEEVRGKLSELCQKPVRLVPGDGGFVSPGSLVLVCAAGLSGSSATEAVASVARLRSRGAAPVVICDQGDARFGEHALATIVVPRASPRAAILLNALVGAQFAYECARAIDELASPLRRARETTRAALEEVRRQGSDELSLAPLEGTRARFRAALAPAAREALEACTRGRWNCAVDADLAVRTSNALRLGLGQISLAAPFAPSPMVASRARPSFDGVLEHLLAKLAEASEALRRPVDVLEPPSRAVSYAFDRTPTERLPRGVLVRALAAAGAATSSLADADAAALEALGPAILAVEGSTIYAMSGIDPLGAPTEAARIQVLHKTGIAARLRSRADHGCALSGTKRRIVLAPRVHVYRSERDHRTLVLCPLYSSGVICGLALVHVVLARTVSLRDRARALKAAGRYEDLACAVTEVDVAWDDALLEPFSPNELLLAPIEPLAAAIVKRASEARSAHQGGNGRGRGERNGGSS